MHSQPLPPCLTHIYCKFLHRVQKYEIPARHEVISQNGRVFVMYTKRVCFYLSGICIAED